MFGSPNGTVDIGDVEFDDGSFNPSSLEIIIEDQILNAQKIHSQITVLGKLPDGNTVDLSSFDSGTQYFSSNNLIAGVGIDGTVMGRSDGPALLTARNEGVVATIPITVQFSDDTDNDGMPDDYEVANSIDPGGVNVSSIPGATPLASSFSSGFGPERAFDGDPNTSWFAAAGDSANQGGSPYIETTFPQDFNISQLRILGNRSPPDGQDIFAGVVQAFDVNGTEIFNSGEVLLPLPNQDATVAIDTDNVRRIRFTSTQDESPQPGIADLEILTRAGAAGLDLNNPNDALLDFDLDTLTNLDEFNLGTSIWHSDTDGDGLSDANEGTLGSNPLLADTDNDGLTDGQEIALGTQVLLADSDGDGLNDGIEVRIGLNPLNTNSDGDAVPDGSEDTDGDGITNIDEVLENIDPGNPDTDGDGLDDLEEITPGADGLITDARKADTDGDGLPDGFENDNGFNPLDPADGQLDADGDGISNGDEFRNGTDPFNPDTTPPMVAQISPADGATDVFTNRRVIVRLTETVQPASIDGAVRLVQNGFPVSGTTAVSPSGLEITFDPDATLNPNTVYTVQVEGVRDSAGNVLNPPVNSTFTTGTQTDNTPPNILSVSIPDASQNVPVNAPFTVVFDERMDPATMTDFTVSFGGSQLVSGIVETDPSGMMASFIPDTAYPINSQMTVSVGLNVQDASGNGLAAPLISTFTTSNQLDTGPPELVASFPSANETGVPINAVVVLQFNEPLATSVDLNTAVTLTRTSDGQAVAGSLALSDADRRIVFSHAVPLDASTSYTVTLSTDLVDLAGKALSAPIIYTYNTGNQAVTNSPVASLTHPQSGATGVPINTQMILDFTEAVIPLTVNADTFEILGATAVGDYSVSSDRLRATFTPTSNLVPLVPYQVLTMDILGLDGQATNVVNETFVTGTATDETAPTVLLSSIDNGLADVAVNAQIQVQLSEAAGQGATLSDLIKVSVGGVEIAGTVTLDTTRTLITFTADQPLATSTTFDVVVDGFTDGAGNTVQAFASSFTTSASATSDGTAPAVTAMLPNNGASDVSINSAIALTFNEAVNSITANSQNIAVSVVQSGLIVAGSFATSNNTVTFTPSSPMQGNVTVQVDATNVTDLAGNSMTPFSASFVTENVADSVQPLVVMATPPNNATEVSPQDSIVVTFSEPVSAGTLVPNSTLSYVVNGAPVMPAFTLTADGRTLTITNALAEGSTISLAFTAGVTDLAGNGLVPFQTTFNTASTTTGGRPSVAALRPGNGGMDVSVNAQISLFMTVPVNPTTLSAGFTVTQNGIPVTGTVSISSRDQVISLIPDQPLLHDALIEVSVTTDVLGILGEPAFNFTGSFRTEEDPSLTGPFAEESSPSANATGQPTNTVVEVKYNEPLNPGTVDNTSVTLSAGGNPVTSTVSLVRGGRVVRIVPDAPLAPNTVYTTTITQDVRDISGAAASFFMQAFTTGGGADNIMPEVVLFSPPDGAERVGTNASMFIRFDESINPLTVDESSVQITDGSQNVLACTISFTNGNRDVKIVPHQPLNDNAQYTVHIQGVEDRAGNTLVPFNSAFETDLSPDLAAPVLVEASPMNGAQQIPVNTTIRMELNEQVDPFSFSVSNIELRRNFDNFLFPASYSLSDNGKIIHLNPTSNLNGNTDFTVIIKSGLRDLAGNSGLTFTSGAGVVQSGSEIRFGFRTNTTLDSTPPSIVAVGPADGFTDVPTNALIGVHFNERIQELNVEQVVLSAGGNEVPVKRSVAHEDNLTLRPLAPLTPSTTYTLVIDGIQDIAGNSLAPQTTTFTTGNSVDLDRPGIVAANPLNGTQQVPVNTTVRVEFDEPIDPSSFVPTYVELRRNFDNFLMPVTFIQSADGKVLTLDPTGNLNGNTDFTVIIKSGLRDLAGNKPAVVGLGTVQSGSEIRFGFRTNTTNDSTPPAIVFVGPEDGFTNVPLNVQVGIHFNERIQDLDHSRVTLSAGGIPVEVNYTLAHRDNLTLNPVVPLDPNTLYTLEVAGVRDIAGNLLATQTTTFTTGTQIDNTAPLLVEANPANGSQQVATNVAIRVEFDEAIDPSAVNSMYVELRRNFDNFFFPATLSQTFDGRVINITPTSNLNGNTDFTVILSRNIRDLAGNTNPGVAPASGAVISGSQIRFGFRTTGSGTDTTPPAIVAVGPEDGFTGVPLNVQMGIQFNEPIQDLNLDLVTLSDGNMEVALNRSVAHRDNLTLNPVAPLNANTLYTLTIAGIRDIAGNLLATQTTTFTTGALLDTQRPTVLAANPLNGTNDVPVNVAIRIEYDEAIDPSSVNSLYVQLRRNFDNFFFPATLSQSFDGRVINITPTSLLNGNTDFTVILNGNLRDLAGNSSPLIGSGSGVVQSGSEIRFGFRTNTTSDSTAPSIVRIGPADGFSDVPLNGQVGIQFSERIQDLNPDLVTLSAGGVEVQASRSLAHRDNFTLTPTSPLSSNTLYTVTVEGIRDTAGNLLPTQTTDFTTGTAIDLDRPVLVAATPRNGMQAVPVNTTVRVEFDEPIDPSSFVSSYVELRRNFDNFLMPVTFIQSADGKVLTLDPTGNLNGNTDFTVIIKSGLRDLAGNKPPIIGFNSGVFQSGSEIRFGFRTNTTSDSTAPSIVRLGPANGFINVPTNAQVGIQFSERIQDLDQAQVTLSAGGTEVAVTRALAHQDNLTLNPVALLDPNTLYTVTVQGIRDTAGNLMPTVLSTFTTGTLQDSAAPVLIAANPLNGMQAVPVNTTIRVEFNEPIDPSSFVPTYVELRRNFDNFLFPVTFIQSVDGRVLTLDPTSDLNGNTDFTVIIKSGLRDLAGNKPPVIGSGSGTVQSGSEIRFGFRTNTTNDGTAPSIVAVGPQDGFTNVSTNVQVGVQFSERIQGLDQAQFTLSAGGIEVSSSRSLSSTLTNLTLNPVSPLAANTLYTVRVEGVRDIAGNLLPTQTTTFTTGAVQDTTQPTLTSASPANGTNGVAIAGNIVMTFNEAIDPSTFNVTYVELRRNFDNFLFPVTFIQSADGKVLTLDPTSNLNGNTDFTVIIKPGLRDLSGNQPPLLGAGSGAVQSGSEIRFGFRTGTS